MTEYEIIGDKLVIVHDHKMVTISQEYFPYDSQRITTQCKGCGETKSVWVIPKGKESIPPTINNWFMDLFT